jgi:hypothetical protein
MSERSLDISVGTELSIRKAILLHLLPGLFLLCFYIAGTKLAPLFHVPTMFMLYLGIIFILIPFELGYMLLLGKKANRRLTLSGIILFRQPLRWWWYILIILPLLIWGFLLLKINVTATDDFLWQQLFHWLPRWFYLRSGAGAGYAKPVLLAFWGFYFVCNISGAFIEELYFRGFLLPRLARLGFWAPLLNTVLFSFYHFFTPEANISRILLLLPMVYAVWWKRNINIGILLHCAGNAVGLFVMLGEFLR